MTIVFRNPGLVDLRALTTLGVNVKPDSTNPIGYFGTGFKFAVATLLRNSCTITLWRGLERHSLTAKPVTIRGAEFSVVCLDDRELGFTTDLGKNWAPWQAYRELYCNAIDENGEVLFLNTALPPFNPNALDEPIDVSTTQYGYAARHDETAIIVTGGAIDHAHAGRHEFLLLDPPSLILPGVTVYKRPAKALFYRGIAAFPLQRPSLHTWNITVPMQLSEDRQINYYVAQLHIAQAIASSDDESFISSTLFAPRDESFEGKIDFAWSSVIGGSSETFKSVVAKAARHRRNDMNPSALTLLNQWGDDFNSIALFSPDAIQAQQLAIAVEFCTALGFDVLSYPIFLAERLGKMQYGQAHNGRIYLTREAFEAGTKIVAGTLIEEFVHLREGFGDMTRELQNFLLNRVVTLGERLQGKAL